MVKISPEVMRQVRQTEMGSEDESEYCGCRRDAICTGGGAENSTDCRIWECGVSNC